MNDNQDPNSFDSYKMIGGGEPQQEPQSQTVHETPRQPSDPRPPLSTPHANQYAAMSARQPGRAGGVFWSLFALLAILDILLVLGGSGLLFFVLSVVVLVVMFLIRKKISHGILKTILYFGGALLVTIVLFAVAGTGESSETAGNSAEKVFDFSLSVGSKDEADVVKEGFARSVDPDTLKPIEKVTAFSPNDEFMYYSVFVKYLPENTKIVSRWYYEGNLVIETEPVIVAAPLQDQYYTTHLQKGDKPFPPGNYQVEVVMSKEGQTIFQCSDQFVVAAAAASVPATQAQGENILFADSFQRPDAGSAGSQWQEVRMRNGTGSSIPSSEAGDTPWSIKNNTLTYEGVGNNTYTEDFIQTVQEFPIDNTKVEFEMRGTATTMLGYVGPGVFWAPAQELRLGSFTTVDGQQPLIGIQAFYGWESQGTKGLIFRLGSSFQTTDGILGGINQSEFVKHTIILKDGKMTYQAGDGPSVTYDLVSQPEQGAKRHLSFDVRYYDNGVPFKTEIRNVKITSLG